MLKKWLISTAAVLFLAATMPLQAQPGAPAGGPIAQADPVVVISITGATDLMKTVQHLTKVVGQEQAGMMASIFATPYIQALDGERPSGVVIAVGKSEEVEWYGFVPVKDLKALLKALEATMGEAKEAGDGVYELEGPQPVFVKESSGWAYVAPSAEALAELPADPTKALDGLYETYDVAARVYMQKIPASMREMVVSQMQSSFEMGLEKTPDESDAQYKLRKAMAEFNMEEVDHFINQSDVLTLGLSVEEGVGLNLTFDVTAMPGTDLAALFDAYQESKSDFAGFQTPEAAVTYTASVAKMPQSVLDQYKELAGLFHDSVNEQIATDDSIDTDEQRAAAKKIVDSLFELIDAQIADGRLDLGAAAVFKPGDLTILAGGYVAAGGKVEPMLKEFVEVVKDEPDFPGVKFNAETYKGLNFHTMAVPVPEDGQNMFGETLNVIVATNDNALYVAVGGAGCNAELKKVIDLCQQNAGQAGPPGKMAVDLGMIMEFAAAVSEDDTAIAMAEALKAAGDKDRILITIGPEGKSLRYSIDIEEGILQAIGKAVNDAMGGM